MSCCRQCPNPVRLLAVQRIVGESALALATILGLLSTLDVAAACAMCMGFGTPSQAWDRDGAIFECLPIERLDFAADPRDSMNVDIGLAVFRVRVTRVWKGDPDPVTEISTLERAFECPVYVPRIGEPFLCWVVADEFVGNRWKIRRGLHAGESSGAAALLDAMLELDPTLTAHSRDEALLQRFSNLLDSADRATQIEAAAAIGEFEDDALATLPRLFQLFEQAEDAEAVVVFRAIKVIGRSDDVPAEASLRMLRVGPSDLRRWALNQLCGPQGHDFTRRAPLAPAPSEEQAIAGLRLGLRDVDPKVRKRAAEILYEESARGRWAAGVEITREALHAESRQARLGVLEALNQGEWGRSLASSELAPLLADSSALIRAWSALALGRLELSSEELRRDLLPLLDDPSHRVRTCAIESLGRRGERGLDVMPSLRSLVGGTDDSVRAEALLALGRFPPEHTEAWSLLTASLEDAHPIVRAAAAAVLLRSDSRPAWAAAPIEALGDARDPVFYSEAFNYYQIEFVSRARGPRHP